MSERASEEAQRESSLKEKELDEEGACMPGKQQLYVRNEGLASASRLGKEELIYDGER